MSRNGESLHFEPDTVQDGEQELSQEKKAAAMLTQAIEQSIKGEAGQAERGSLSFTRLSEGVFGQGAAFSSTDTISTLTGRVIQKASDEEHTGGMSVSIIEGERKPHEISPIMQSLLENVPEGERGAMLESMDQAMPAVAAQLKESGYKVTLSEGSDRIPSVITSVSWGEAESRDRERAFFSRIGRKTIEAALRFRGKKNGGQVA